MKAFWACGCLLAFAASHIDGQQATDEGVFFSSANNLKCLAVARYAPLVALDECSVKENAVSIWNLAQRKQLRKMLHKQTVLALALSDDGTMLASSSTDQTVAVWSVATGEKMYDYNLAPGAGFALQFSPDAKTLAIIRDASRVDLIEIATGKIRGSLYGQIFASTLAHNHSLAFSNDGKILAAPGKKNSVILWDVYTGKETVLLGHQDKVTGVAFSHKRKWLASVSEDRSLIIWDLKNGKPMITLGEPELGRAYALAFSGDGATLVAGGSGSDVCVWDLATAKLRGAFMGHRDCVYGVAFSPDGTLFSIGDRTLREWSIPKDNFPRRWK